MAEENILITQEEGITIVSLGMASILEEQAINEIGDTLYELVDKKAIRKLIVSFSDVNFLSSSMIGVLVALHKKSKAIDGNVVLCGLKPALMKVFTITRLDKVLTFAEDEAEAKKKLLW